MSELILEYGRSAERDETAQRRVIFLWILSDKH